MCCVAPLRVANNHPSMRKVAMAVSITTPPARPYGPCDATGRWRGWMCDVTMVKEGENWKQTTNIYEVHMICGVFGGLQVKLTSNPALHCARIRVFLPGYPYFWLHSHVRARKWTTGGAKGWKLMENHQYRLQARCGVCLVAYKSS